MKAVKESDEAIAPGVIARQLQCRFHGFRAGIAEIDSLGEIAGSDGGKLFSHFGQQRVIEVRARHVDQHLRLALDGAYHFRMTVAGGNDCNTGAEIEESVAVYILDQHTLAAFRYQGVIAKVRRRDELLVEG